MSAGTFEYTYDKLILAIYLFEIVNIIVSERSKWVHFVYSVFVGIIVHILIYNNEYDTLDFHSILPTDVY